MVLFCVSLQNALPGKPASGQVISHDLSCGSEPRWDSVNVTGGWYVIGFSLHGRHAHIPNLLTLEHVAKCVLMRNSWSGSAQIKDIPVRELPPVSPSCSAASKWILQPLPPAGAARAQGWHSMCQLPFLDEQTTLSLRSCHYLMPGQTGDYRGQGTFLHYSSGHFSNWEHINTTSLRVFIISKPNMAAFSSSCSLRKECYTYSIKIPIMKARTLWQQLISLFSGNVTWINNLLNVSHSANSVCKLIFNLYSNLQR